MNILKNTQKHFLAVIFSFLAITMFSFNSQSASAEISPIGSSGTSASALDLSGLWSGSLVGGTENPEIKNAHVEYIFDVSSSPSTMEVNETLTVSQVDRLMNFDLVGGKLGNNVAQNGNWSVDPILAENCPTSTSVSVDADTYAFSMCAKVSGFDLVSSDTTVLSCSESSCTGLKAGTVTLTATPKSTQAYFRGLKNGSDAWIDSSINIPANSVSWNVTVYNIPTAQINATSTVTAGTPFNLTWTSANATSCTGNWTTNPIATSDIVSLSINIDTTFQINCTGQGGGTATAQKTVSVESSIQQPVISLVSNINTVYPGQTITIDWQVTGADTCTAYGGFGDWSWVGGADQMTGTYTTTPLTILGDNKFHLYCEKEGKSGKTETLVIPVNDNSVTPIPSVSLTSDKSKIIYMETVTLSWQAVNVYACEAIGPWPTPGDISFVGSETTPPLFFNSTFTIECLSNFSATPITSTVTIEVAPQVFPELTVFYTYDHDDNPTTAPTVVQEADFESSYLERYTDVNFNWTSINAIRCTRSNSTLNNIGKFGNWTEWNLFQPVYNYSITCYSADGTSTTKLITVNFNPQKVGLDIYADRGALLVGESTDIHWRTEVANSCFSLPVSSGMGWTSATSKGTWGNENTGPLMDEGIYIYRMQCFGAGADNTIIKQVEISVVKSLITPADQEFMFWSDAKHDPAYPDESNVYIVDYQASPNLLWEAPFATSCVASGSWSGSRNTSGIQRQWNFYSNKIYYLTCSSDTMIDTRTVIINVRPPEVPTIMNLIVDKNPMDFGTSNTIRFTVKWNNIVNDGGCYGKLERNDGYIENYIWFSDAAGSNNEDHYRTLGPEWWGETKDLEVRCWNSSGETKKLLTVVVGDPPAPPTLNFFPTTYTPALGESNYLHWDVKNSNFCTGSGGTFTGRKSAPGFFNHFIGEITQDTTYSLTCIGTNNQAVTKVISIYPGLKAPKIFLMTDSKVPFTTPGNVVPYNTGTTLRWRVVTPAGKTATCTGEQGTSDWKGAKPTQGEFDTGKLKTTTLFTLVCSNSNGSSTQSVALEVGPPTATGPQLSFWADDNIADASYKETLHLKMTEAFVGTQCAIYKNDTLYTTVAPSAGTIDITAYVDPAVPKTTFTATCKGPSGNMSGHAVVVPLNASKPSMDIDFWADEISNIPEGAGAMVRWNSQGVDSCEALGEYKYTDPVSGEEIVINPWDGWSGEKYTNGNASITDLAKGVYTLRLKCTKGTEELNGVVMLFVGMPSVGAPVRFYDIRTVDDVNNTNPQPVYIKDTGEYMMLYSISGNEKYLTFKWETLNAETCQLTDLFGLTNVPVSTNASILIDSTMNRANEFRLTCTDTEGGQTYQSLVINVYRYEICIDSQTIAVGQSVNVGSIYAESIYSAGVSNDISGISCSPTGIGPENVTSSTNFSVDDSTKATLDNTTKVLTGDDAGLVNLTGAYAKAPFGILSATLPILVIEPVQCYVCNVDGGVCREETFYSTCRPLSGEYETQAHCSATCEATLQMNPDRYIEVNP